MERFVPPRFTQRFSALVLFAMMLNGPAWAADAQATLEQRVQALERQVLELNQRLEQAEKHPAANKAPAYTVPIERVNAPAVAMTPGWQSAANWKKLRRGMSQIQVTQLLGEPPKRSGDRDAERWHYPDDSAWVEFDQVTEVSGWKAP